MCKIIDIDDVMVRKVSKLIYIDFTPSEISKMLNKPIEKIYEWMLQK